MMKSKEKPIILLCNVGLAPQVIAQAIRVTAQGRNEHRNGVVVVVSKNRALPWEIGDFAKGCFVELCAQCLSALSEIGLDTSAPISESESDVTPEASRHRICAATCEVNLTPREFFFYAMYALFREQARDGDGAVSLNALTVEDFDRTLRHITKACGRELSIAECHRSKHFKFLREMIEQMTSASRKRDIDFQDFKEKLRVTFARIRRKIRDAGLPANYAVQLRKERGEAYYCLSLPPEKLKFAYSEAELAGKVAGQGEKPLAA